jgi:predicted nucleotidyltransferase
LLKFFLNPSSRAYLRNLEAEFGDSTNAIRLELNKFVETGLLSTEVQGNKKIYKANTRHPLFEDIHNILRKYVGVDKIIETLSGKLGDVEKVYLTGSFATGIDAPVIDLILIGKINKTYLVGLIEKAESLVKRKIRYIIYEPDEFDVEQISDENILLLWDRNK